MLESLLDPENADKRPWETFWLGFLFTIAAGLLTLQIGGARGGFLFVAFISIAAAPFFLRVFDFDEKRGGKNFFDRHYEIIKIYAFFFLSVIFASSLMFVFLPNDNSVLFSDQLEDLCARGITSDPGCGRIIVSGDASGTLAAGYASSNAVAPEFTLVSILINNLEVLALAFIFSFVLGAGAVFLISWNATIIGTLIGKIAENPVAYGAIQLAEDNIVTNYLVALPWTLLRLLPHGIFEFGGYFFGAVAGGILSVAIVREQILSGKFGRVLTDSFIYLGISVVLITIGALIEVAV
jgi:uncharacterized membrane protein SpoIIM required for sporulation